MKNRHILLGVTGSIAAFKAADLTARLTAAGAEVTVILTESAQKFITPLTFESLSHRQVLASMWQRSTLPEPVHVSLAEWTDLMVVCPASANFMAKLAHGIADDLLSCMAITVTRPPIIAPAMNDAMWRHPATQANYQLLQQRGCAFIGPIEGRLASGKIGIGRLANLDDIFAAIQSALL